MPAWIEELGKLAAPAELEAYFAGRPELHQSEAVERLVEEVIRLARLDRPRAEKMSAAASRLAEIVGDDCARALSLKARGHLRYLVGDYEAALALYRDCQKCFLAAGAEVDAAVNLGSSMWMLALLGRYDQAWADSRAARQTLERHGDPLQLARLTVKEAQILHRQDRHHDALERCRSALELFRQGGEPQDVTVALHNIAVSSIAINDFEGALETYGELSAWCSEHELPALAAQADYNIAYLYFWRGEYARAIGIYQQTRKSCEELEDRYHLALCDLDQAEIYLDLNLHSEAARLARLAFDAFEEQGNGYEAAKALSFLAIAANYAGDHKTALHSFSLARERFEAEGNHAWAAMMDFYRALISHEQLRPHEARELCGAAREFFAGVPWPSRVALCDLLLAQIDHRDGRKQEARQRCLAALQSLEPLELPALSLKALTLLGRCEEALGEEEAALQAYQRAHDLLESLRTHLVSEESKIAFLGDKQQVYESLVHLTLEKSRSASSLRRAFGYIEQAKSRILADLMASGGSYLLSSSDDNPELVDRLSRLREDLNLHHNELRRLYNLRASGEGEPADAPEDGTQAAHTATSAAIETLERGSRECEKRLLDTLRELGSRDSDFARLFTAETASFEAIRASLPRNALLLEYFEARGVIYACVLGADRFEIRRVTETAELRPTIEHFVIQISKYQLGEAYLELMGEANNRSILTCLQRFYSALVGPVAELLEAEHLIVVPHGMLHQIPFHALLDGDSFLLDRFHLSYAPSASLYSTLQASTPRSHDQALVLAVPDERAPVIRQEVEVVSQHLPGARVFVGETATAERLRSLGAESRIVHIATHGFFRQDNPMFSAIQLADSRLTVLDLYNLKLNAELVVLSGCSTGLHKIEVGDELIGLTRGLLYAGARSLMTTLWDVHDASTAALMQAFYSHLLTAPDRATALGRAMRELRAEYPSPYYWAPFILIGRYADAAPPPGQD